jgi:WD40 repeat protein
VGNRQQIGESLTGPYGGGLSVAFSPDGKIVASEGGDNSIILWDVENRQQIGEPLKGHTDGVTT